MSATLAEFVPRLKRIVPRMRGKRIGVVGDLMLDRYLWGTASRLSPEAAVPVVDFVEQSECLGGAGNVAANLAALGARVEMFGVIGGVGSKDAADEPGAALRKCLRGGEYYRQGRASPIPSASPPSRRGSLPGISTSFGWIANVASRCVRKPKSAC